MKVPQPRKLPSGTWFCNLRLGGENIPVSASSERECARKAALIKAEYLNGKKRNRSNPVTLREAIDSYIDSRSNALSPATIAGYRAIQRLYFPGIIDRPLSANINWQAQINNLAKTHSGKTVKNAWGFISSVLREQNIEFGRITLPQVIETEKEWLDPEQISIFVDAVINTNSCIPLLFALHGLRRSEIMALTWEHIDLKANTFLVAGASVYDEHHRLVDKEENKNTTSRRRVPIMIPELRDALFAVEDQTGKVVRCSPNTLWKWAKKACQENDLPPVGVHGLRHSFASLAYHLKLSELETMELGGWKDRATMHRIYTHLSARDALAAQNKIAEFYRKRK